MHHFNLRPTGLVAFPGDNGPFNTHLFSNVHLTSFTHAGNGITQARGPMFYPSPFLPSVLEKLPPETWQNSLSFSTLISI